MASDMFLKIEGIDGESTDEKHSNWIDILSFNHNVSQSGSADGSSTGGHTSGRVDIGEMVFAKMLDKSTPKLIEAACTGKHIPTAEIELCSATGAKHTFMKYKLSKVIVSTVTTGGSGEGSRPEETLMLKFEKIEWEYTPYDNTGKSGNPVRAGWDRALNKTV